MSWLLLTLFVGDPRAGLTDPLERALDYALRTDESLVGLLLAHAYFSYWLGPAWRDRRDSSGQRVEIPPSTGTTVPVV